MGGESHAPIASLALKALAKLGEISAKYESMWTLDKKTGIIVFKEGEFV